MSEFLAEAQVLVRPDTTTFRAELQAQLAAIKVAPISVPIVAAGAASLTAAAAGTAALSAAQATATGTATGLATATRVANTSWATQATILPVVTAETQALAGAQVTAAAASKAGAGALLGFASAGSKLDAALLGLRTLLGSAAVIGLSATALAAIAAGKGIRAAIAAFADFQTELLTFRATTGATADEMVRVSEAALALGADISLPSVSAGDAAQAMTQLAKAGLSTEEAIAGARGVLQLATAAQIDNAAASELAASALNAFGLSGDQAVRVADDLANAANAAQGSIADMGIALQQSAAVARQVGINLEDTVSILTLLARNGLRGSDAGTSLRTALLRLVNPTKEATTLIRTLGISIRDAQGNIRPDVFAQFAEATAALSPAMRDAIAATVFGQDAIRAVAIAGREGADGLRLMQFQIDQQGTAAELAAARTSGLAGAFSGLMSNVETLGINLGRLVTGPLEDFINNLSRIVTGADKVGEALAKIANFEFPGGEKLFPEPVQKQVKGFTDTVRDVGKRFLGPQAGFFLTLNASIDVYNKLVGNASERNKELQATLLENIRALQGARIAAEQAQPGSGEAFTPAIEALRERLRAARIEAGDILPPKSEIEKALDPLFRALQAAQRGREIAIEFGLDAAPFDRAIADAQQKIRVFVSDVEAGLKKVNKVSFADIAKNLQLALRGFALDPTGERAAGFLRDARRIARQLANLAPDVSAAARQAFVGPLKKAIQDAINAAVSAGDLEAAQKIEKYFENLMKSAGLGIKKGADLFVVPAMQEAIDAALAPSGLAIAQAQAAGSDSALLAALQNRRAAIKRELQAAGLSIAQETQLNLELASTNDQIQAIFDQRAADQREATSKIQQAKDDADQAFLDAMNLGESRLQNRIARAGGTEALKDDIAANVAFKKFVQNQIRLAKQRITDAQLLATTLATLNASLIRVTQTIANLRAQQRKALQDARKERIARARESVELDVQIAEATGNKAAIRRALEAEIAFYRERIRATRRGSIERKRWILALRQAQAELRDLKDEQKEVNNAFKALAFEFLQAQQGFAANLMGNLIPGDFLGLVGNVSTAGAAGATSPAVRVAPGGAVNPEDPRSILNQAHAQASLIPGGPSKGQAATEINLLERIVQVLLRIERGAGHPEARKSKVRAGASMEGGGGVASA